MNRFYELTDNEKQELSERLAAGDVAPNPTEEKDHFYIGLSSGRIIYGSYCWDMDWGEFSELEIV